jgi:hypothetical protein
MTLSPSYRPERICQCHPPVYAQPLGLLQRERVRAGEGGSVITPHLMGLKDLMDLMAALPDLIEL